MLDQNDEMTGQTADAADSGQTALAGRPQANLPAREGASWPAPAGNDPREGTGGGQRRPAGDGQMLGAPSPANTETGGDARADRAKLRPRESATGPAPDPHTHPAGDGGEATATPLTRETATPPSPSSRPSPKGARAAHVDSPTAATDAAPRAKHDQGQISGVSDGHCASALIDGEGGQAPSDPHIAVAPLPSPLDASPLVSEIVETWRRRQAFVEARRKLILQGRALCRRVSGGDKAAGAALYAGAEAGADPDAALIVGAILAAQAPLSAEIAALDRHMVKCAKRLPVADWARAQKGYGLPGLAKTVGELGDLSAYHKGVAGIWKRAGLAVIDGGRQRKVAGDAALLHGYAPARRSTFWNIAAAILKGQGTGDAAGPWRLVYDARKAHEAGRVETPMHAHNRAMRYMTKRLLRDLWREWRAVA